METKISVLLADPGEQYRAAYSKAIGQETDMELVAQTDNGLRAEELITKFQPDVVVLDLVLPNLDGLSLLTHLRAKNASSRVIVTSAICNDQVLMECAELGTTYFMQKPFDPPLLVQRIRQTARPRQRTGGAGTQLAAAEPEPSLESVVTDVIHEIGVPAHIKGYQYLREAILLTIDDMDIINSVTKVLYPELARRARHPARDRGRVGSRRYRDAAEVFRLHGLEHQGQADEFGVHRHDRRLPEPAAEAGERALNAQQEKKRMQKAPGRNVRGLSVFFMGRG